jgi:hypothetical protein
MNRSTVKRKKLQLSIIYLDLNRIPHRRFAEIRESPALRFSGLVLKSAIVGFRITQSN